MSTWITTGIRPLASSPVPRGSIPLLLLHMWRYPRMVAWFILTVALYLLARLPFRPVEIIPYYLDFNPGLALVPLAGIFWGPAGALGCLAGSLLSDALMGSWNILTPWRAAGLFLAALSAQRLWSGSGRYVAPTTSASQRFHFMFVAWPGCFINAAWLGTGSELARLYPFPYFAGLALAANLLFVTLLGLEGYRFASRHLCPRWGTWQDVMLNDLDTIPGLNIRGMILAWTGSYGAVLVGGLAAWFIYDTGPLRSAVLGTPCGPWVPALVIPLLLLQVVDLFFIRADRQQ